MPNTPHCWTSEQEEWESTHPELPWQDWYKRPCGEDGYPRDWICMLPDGHDGPHEWTDPARIMLSFPEDPGA